MYKRRQMGTGLEQYKLYVLGNYGKATVVFDWHSVTVCTKDSAHMGWTGGKVRTAVHFIVFMTLWTEKKMFLSNQESKHMFPAMLFRHLKQSGFEVHQDIADGDLLTVQTTRASVPNQDTLFPVVNFLKMCCYRSRLVFNCCFLRHLTFHKVV